MRQSVSIVQRAGSLNKWSVRHQHTFLINRVNITWKEYIYKVEKLLRLLKRAYTTRIWSMAKVHPSFGRHISNRPDMLWHMSWMQAMPQTWGAECLWETLPRDKPRHKPQALLKTSVQTIIWYKNATACKALHFSKLESWLTETQIL